MKFNKFNAKLQIKLSNPEFCVLSKIYEHLLICSTSLNQIHIFNAETGVLINKIDISNHIKPTYNKGQVINGIISDMNILKDVLFIFQLHD